MGKHVFKFDTLATAKQETLYSPALAKIIDGDNSRIIGNKVGAENNELIVVGNALSDASIQAKQRVLEMVDLGLSVLWADRNLGSKNQQDYGKYYAWGDTTGYAENEVSEKFSSSWYSDLPASQISSNLTATNDAATVALGSGYRTPTKTEMEELLTLEHEAVNVGGIDGMRFSGNNNSIFIPFAGYVNSGTVRSQEDDAFVWSSIYRDSGTAPTMCCSYDGNAEIINDTRYYGFTIRPVCAK